MVLHACIVEYIKMLLSDQSLPKYPWAASDGQVKLQLYGPIHMIDNRLQTCEAGLFDILPRGSVLEGPWGFLFCTGEIILGHGILRRLQEPLGGNMKIPSSLIDGVKG